MSCLTDEKSAKVSLFTCAGEFSWGGLFEVTPLQVSSPLLDCIIALLAPAAVRLGRVYCNLIIQQLMRLRGPALITTVRLLISRLIYYVHSQAIKQDVRLPHMGFKFKKEFFGLKSSSMKQVGITPF